MQNLVCFSHCVWAGRRS